MSESLDFFAASVSEPPKIQHTHIPFLTLEVCIVYHLIHDDTQLYIFSRKNGHTFARYKYFSNVIRTSQRLHDIGKMATAGYVDDTQDYDMPLHERNRRAYITETIHAI
jgi:hypothetical protein